MGTNEIISVVIIVQKDEENSALCNGCINEGYTQRRKELLFRHRKKCKVIPTFSNAESRLLYHVRLMTDKFVVALQRSVQC